MQPNLPLKKQDPKTLTEEITASILRLAKMYQVPNFDEVNAVLLADWVIEEYQHHELDLVQEALRKPPVLNDPAWRLTPDTLKVWIDLKRSERVEMKQRAESLIRQTDSQPEHKYTEDVNALIADYLNQLKEGPQVIRSITEKEVKEEGQLRPKKKEYVAPGADYFNEWQKKMREYQERVVRERHPGWTDAEIEQRLREINS